MFGFITKMFGGSSVDDEGDYPAIDPQNVPLAAAVLLVCEALQDEAFEATEEQAIIRMLSKKFQCTRVEALQLLQQAHDASEDKEAIFYYTKILKDVLDEAGRVEVLEMLWEVAQVDGALDDEERQWVERVAQMLNVPESELESARIRALEDLAREEKLHYQEQYGDNNHSAHALPGEEKPLNDSHTETPEEHS